MNDEDELYFPEPEEDGWMMSLDLDINAVRSLHDSLNHYLEIWPGAPRRPADEQEFIRYIRNKLFMGMTDYNFYYNEHK